MDVYRFSRTGSAVTVTHNDVNKAQQSMETVRFYMATLGAADVEINRAFVELEETGLTNLKVFP